MKDYMRELRRLVGCRPLIMVGAVVAVFDAQNRILLQHRTDNGSWGLLGGSMEPGEQFEETARREAREESGLEVDELELFGLFSGPELFYEYPNGDQVYNVGAIYTCRKANGNLRPSSEGSELRYFAIDALPESISPPDAPILRKVVEHIIRTSAL